LTKCDEPSSIATGKGIGPIIDAAQHLKANLHEPTDDCCRVKKQGFVQQEHLMPQKALISVNYESKF